MTASLFLATFDGHALGNALLRWIHILAGVLWIGHLYFFNFVNSELAKTYDADTKRKVVPELMPRALFWFRWGAAYTWLSGVALLAMLYWTKANFTTDGTSPSAMQILGSFGFIVVGFLVYDRLASALAKQPMVSLYIWAAIAVAFAWAMTNTGFFAASQRAAFIHAGALFGTSMAANVWMRIWPAQKRIISAIKAGQAPNAADAALAGLRSKHNTYMSVPLLFLMLGVHQAEAGVFGGDAWMWVLGLCVLGFAATSWLYTTATKVKGF
jgi:uncharacterized membrane protein